jgi:hypothetical protein
MSLPPFLTLEENMVLRRIIAYLIEPLLAELRTELRGEVAVLEMALNKAFVTLTTEQVASVRTDTSKELKNVGLALIETRRVIENLDHKMKMLAMDAQIQAIRSPEPQHIPLIEKKPAGAVDLTERVLGNIVDLKVGT